VQARIVSQLPVPQAQGQVPTDVSKLVTEHDYDTYIETRTAAWKASRTDP
jgi:hypothetical protein